MDDLTLRALRAYRNDCKGSNEICQQPDGDDSGAQHIAGREYVILRNVRGVFAVYSHIGGRLARLMQQNWPAGIN